MSRFLCVSYLGLLLQIYPLSSLMAQQLISEKADIVTINGNHISGQLYFDITDNSFTIKPAGEIIMKVPSNIIKSVKIIYDRQESDPGNRNTKIYNNTTFGLVIGNSMKQVRNSGNITATTVLGIVFKPWLQAGLGIGYDLYELSLVVPFFISISGNLFENNITPFYFVEAGTSTAWTYNTHEPYYYSQYDDAEGKAMFQFGFGYKVYLVKNVNFGLSVGFRIQHVIYRSNFGYESVVSDINYKRMVLKMVIGF